MSLIDIPYGDRKISFQIPDEKLAYQFKGQFPSPVEDLEAEVVKTLEKPAAGVSFSKLLKAGKKVMILSDNFARLTPCYQLLPPILRMIQDAGAQPEIMVASGNLREMNESELKRKFGEEIINSGVPIYQSRCRDSWDFEFLGLTSFGTPINIHRKVLEADVTLAVTMTQATLWGYGGGPSMILPGVSSYESTEWNHRLSTAKYSSVGYEPPKNLMRQDMVEHMNNSGLTMSLLAILDPGLRIIHLGAGETMAAHKVSVYKYDQYYTVDRNSLPGSGLDIAITGSFAGDRFFAHSCWAVANMDFFVKDGGAIILATPAEGGLAHYAYSKDYMPPTSESFRRLYEDIFYGKQPLWHAALWFPILKVLAKKELIVVTEKRNLPLFEKVKLKAVTSMEEAFKLALSSRGSKVSVGFFPFGKWILPKGLND